MSDIITKIKSFIESNSLGFYETENDFQINCFSCNDTKKRLGISKKSGAWSCLNGGCGVRGTKLKNLEYGFNHNTKKVTKIATEKEKEEVSRIKPNFHEKFIDDLYEDDYEDDYNYLVNERKLSEDTIEHFKLGVRWEFKTRNGKSYDAGDYIVIPYIQDGKCVNIKYRKVVVESKDDAKWRREVGGISALFNVDVTKNHDYDSIIITESEIDCMSFWSIGAKNVVGLTIGAKGFKTAWYDKLERFKKIYLVLDNDSAGQEGAKALAERLGYGRCYNVVLPEDVKDPNDFIKKYTLDDLHKLFENGERFNIAKVRSTRELADDVFYRKFMDKNSVVEPTFDTPWRKINRILGPLKEGFLFVLAGKPKCFMYDSKLIDGDTGDVVTIEHAVVNKLKSTYSLNEATNKIEKMPISNWIDSGVKECFKVSTKIGRNSKLTGSHPMLKFDGWEKVSNLKVGDYIAIPVKYGNFGRVHWHKDKAHLIAGLIAGGSLSGGSTPSYYKEDKKLITRMGECALLFETRMNKLGKYKYSFTSTKGKTNRLASEIRSLKLNVTSKNKRVPSDIFRANKVTVSEFIGMLWSHDGSIHLKDGKTGIEYSSVSEGLIDDLVTLLLRYGINFRKRHKKVKLKGKVFDAYILASYQKDAVKKFLDNIPLYGDKCNVERVYSDNVSRDCLIGFPSEIWTMIRNESELHGISWRDLKLKYWGNKHKKTPSFKTNGNCSKTTLIKINKIIKSEYLDKLINGDIAFTKIVKIESVGLQQCYDLTIPNHNNLIVNDTICHNSGKTTLALNLMRYWGKKHKINSAIYSCEMRGERLLEKWYMMEEMYYNKFDDMDEDAHIGASYRLPLDRMFTFEPTEADELEIDGVVKNIEAIVKRYGVKIMVVDNLHYLCRGENENALLSVATQQLKLMAERLNILLIAITHPRKTNNNKQLTTDDLKGSSTIFQDADVVWLMHRLANDGNVLPDEADGKGEGALSPLAEILVTGRWTEGGKGVLALIGSRSMFKDSGRLFNKLMKSMVDKFKKKNAKKGKGF